MQVAGAYVLDLVGVEHDDDLFLRLPTDALGGGLPIVLDPDVRLLWACRSRVANMLVPVHRYPDNWSAVMAIDPVPAPAPTYRFRCTIGGESVAFNSVSGLALSLPKIEYRDRSGSWFQMPGQLAPLNVTLRRGEPGSVTGGWADWARTIDLSTVEKKDLSISLMNEDGTTPYLTWNVVNAYPVTCTVDDLDGDGTYEFEQLDLVADKFTIQFHT